MLRDGAVGLAALLLTFNSPFASAASPFNLDSWEKSPEIKMSAKKLGRRKSAGAGGCFVTFTPIEAAKGIRHWREHCD